MHNLNLLLLTLGIVKAGVWVAIAVVAFRQRRVLPLIYGPLGVIATTARGLHDAHANVPEWVGQAGAFVGTPIAFLILASLLVTQPTTPVRGKWRF